MSADGGLITLPLSSLTVRSTISSDHCFGAHDLYTFTVAGLDHNVDNPAVATDQPFLINWDQRGSQPAYGYVAYAKPLHNPLDAAAIQCEVTGLGITSQFRQTRQRVWIEDISTIVSTICADYRLNVIIDVEGAPAPRAQIVQPGISDWEFLNKLAADYGCVLFVRGVTVFFLTKSRVIDHAVANNEFRYIDLRGRFTPAVGAASTGGVRKEYVGTGIDMATGSIIGMGTSNQFRPVASTVDKSYVTEYIDRPAGENMARADEIVSTHNERRRWYLSGVVVVDHDPTILPGMVVAIPPSPASSPTQSGAWLVTSAKHRKGRKVSYTELEVSRDSRGSTGFVDRPVARSRNPYGTQVNVAPPAMMRNGLWTSSWRQA